MTESLRTLWAEDRPAFGGWCTIPSTFSAELMARQGFDWVCIDTQHGLIGYHIMVPMLQALSLTGVPPFVRVSWNTPGEIGKALDAGALGVIVPMVSTPEAARAAVAACRYAPEGSRSYGPIRVALSNPYTVEWANRNVLLFVMLETAEAVRNADDILAVPGIDGVYVGPADLSVSLGLPPRLDVEDGVHLEAQETILKACKNRGVVPGMHTGSPQYANRAADRGFRFLALATDSVYMGVGAQQFLQVARGTAAVVRGEKPERPYA